MLNSMLILRVGILCFLALPRRHFLRMDDYNSWNWMARVIQILDGQNNFPELTKAIQSKSALSVGDWILNYVRNLSNLNKPAVQEICWSAMLAWGTLGQARKLHKVVPLHDRQKFLCSLICRTQQYRPERLDVFFLVPETCILHETIFKPGITFIQRLCRTWEESMPHNAEIVITHILTQMEKLSLDGKDKDYRSLLESTLFYIKCGRW